MSQVSVFVKGSIIDLYGQPSKPANPPAGQARMFYNSTTDTFEVIDSNGVVILSGGASTPGVIANTILTANNIVIGAGANAVQDSGTALSSLAPLNSPALVTPNLGTPSVGVLTNCTGLPAASVVSGALANGMTATSQAAFSNDTKLSTDAYADNNFKGVSVAGFRDDFINAPTAATAVTTTAIISGDTPWTMHDINAVAGSVVGLNSTFLNPGQMRFDSGAAGTGDGLGAAKSLSSLGALGSNAGWEINLIFALVQTSSCAIRIGASLNGGYLADGPTDGIWVEYDTANASSNADYTWVTAKNGTGTAYATTGSAGVDTNFHHVRIRSTVLGTIGFTLDGGTEYTTTTDVPTVILQPFIQILTRTNATKSVTMDFFSYMAATGRT